MTGRILHEPMYEGYALSLELREVICERTTAAGQALLIADTVAYGPALFLDGLIQSAACDERLYHETFVLPACLAHGDVKDVIIGGTGEGATLRELRRVPTLRRVISTDLDPEVVTLCREHLPQWSDGALDDPRVTLLDRPIEDVLREQGDASADLVLLDVTDPADEGVSNDVYTPELFAHVRRVLRPDGLVVLQAGEIDLRSPLTIQRVRATLRTAFEQVDVLATAVPSFGALWAVAVAGARGSRVPDESTLRARVDALSPAPRVITATGHRALFESTPLLRAAIEHDAPPFGREQQMSTFLKGSLLP